MDVENNITSCIEGIKLKEQHEEQQRKEKRKFEDIICKLEKDIKSCSTRQDELELEQTQLRLSYASETCTEEELTLKYSVLKTVMEDQNRLLQIETAKLDEIRERVWQNREKFCDSVRQHMDAYGVAAMMNCNFQKITTGSHATVTGNSQDTQDNITYSADVSQTIINENKNLEQEINSRLEIIAKLDVQISELMATKNNLEHEFEEGPEYIRLRSALNYSKADTDRMLKEIEHLKQQQKPDCSSNFMKFSEQTDLANHTTASNCYNIKPGLMADHVNQNQMNNVSQSSTCNFQSSSSLYRDILSARETNAKRKSTNKRGKFTFKSYKDK